MDSRNPDQTSVRADPISLGRLLATFLKIGSIGFGGGMAIIALMEHEFVRERKLISVDEFLHGVGLEQILGPFAVNTSIFLGYRLFGLMGGLLSAGAFLAPSVTLVIILSHLYFRYHSVPGLQGAVAGLGPVVIALILNAGWSVGRKVLRSWKGALISIGALAAGIIKLNTLWVLAVAGAVGFLISRASPPSRDSAAAEKPERGAAATMLPLALPAVAPLAAIGLTFLKIGLVFSEGDLFWCRFFMIGL